MLDGVSPEDLVSRGRERFTAGDLEAAEAAFREADDLGNAEGAMLLGVVLKRRGDRPGAAESFRRAETRGHPEAASSLGGLAWDSGDLAGAGAAYRRSIVAGSKDAVLNLGLLLFQQGKAAEALGYLRSAFDMGMMEASHPLGRILEDRGDLTGAEAVYRPGAGSGDANAAFGLGGVLLKQGDTAGALAGFRRAHELGKPGVEPFLETLEQQLVSTEWAHRYAKACKAVLNTVDACLEVANEAASARAVAARRPQHEISIRTFTHMAEQKEREFAPLYRAFTEACTDARDAAAGLLAGQSGISSELILLTAEEDAINEVATAKGILLANFGSTSAGFIEGIREANALQEHACDDGNIYKPLWIPNRRRPICAVSSRPPCGATTYRQ
jgi:tetratricopeptide (TPR) repeat protein